MVTHDNSLAPRFSRHLVIQDGEIIPDVDSNLPHRDGRTSNHSGVSESNADARPGYGKGKQ
jgi:ABC-type lipoprotein export system ATPase subunit